MRFPFTLVLGLILGAEIAFAQNISADAATPVPIDFVNPGARSLALGGALTGLADDATAAFTNPAGLTTLARLEVAFEGRARRLETPYLFGGRVGNGSPTNVGIDTAAGPIYAVNVSNDLMPAFLSFVLPGGTWALAGYRHEFVRLDQSFQSQGVIVERRLPTAALTTRHDAARDQLTLGLTTYGISGAYRLNDRVSVGAGVTLNHFNATAFGERFDPSPNGPGEFGQPDFSAAQTGVTSDDAQFGIGYTVGGLITPHRGPGKLSLVQIGVVYRRQPSFEFPRAVVNNTPFPFPIFPPPIEDHSLTFAPPTSAAVGLALRFGPSATVTLDVAHVGYASLLDFYPATPARANGRFSIEDGVEPRVGFEYASARRLPISLRVGAWLERDHALKFERGADEPFGILAAMDADVLEAQFPGGRDLTHLAFGAGAAINRWLEVNAGADISSLSRTITLSTIVRLAR
jgi:hypothetical protein